MNPDERKNVADRYSERVRALGPVVQALGWRDEAQQALRFEVMAAGLALRPGTRILDIGCGFGDFYRYLSEHGMPTEYVGCDISPDVLAVARTRHPAITFDLRDILEDPYPEESFDWICMSGIFNHQVADNQGFLTQMLTGAFRMCRRGIAANMTTDQVDYQESHLYYFNPERALHLGRSLSRSVALRHDYPLYEFTMFVYRDGANTTP